MEFFFLIARPITSNARHETKAYILWPLFSVLMLMPHKVEKLIYMRNKLSALFAILGADISKYFTAFRPKLVYRASWRCAAQAHNPFRAHMTQLHNGLRETQTGR